jgi:hypothetical protein
MDNRGENRSQPDHQPGSRVDRTACNPLADREGMSAAIEAGFDHVHWGPKVAMSGLSNTRPAETLASLSSEGEEQCEVPGCIAEEAANLDVEPFGYWVEQKHADPILLRKPAYIPEPSELCTVTPLYLASTHSQSDVIEKCGEVGDLEQARRFFEQHSRPDRTWFDVLALALASKEGQHHGQG